MKVVLLSFLYEPNLGGGAAQVVYSLAHSLVAQGEEVTVITSASKPRPVIEHKDNIKIIRFNPRNLYWVYDKDSQPAWRKIIWQMIDIWNPFVYHAVRGFLESEKPDLVHVHKLRGLSPSVWNAAKSVGGSILMHTCHDYELFSPEGLLNGRIGRLARNRALVMRPYQYLRSKNSALVDLASGPSQFVLEMHKEMGFFRNAKCRLIPNSHGFTLDELSNHRKERSSEVDHPLRLLYLGRLVPEKGIEILCQAFRDCSKYDPKLILDIAGWGFIEESLREGYGQDKSIRFHGVAFGEKKEQLLRECDILVLPSIVLENLPVVITEAYAFGKPVLATRIGGIPEIVREGETGFLTSPGDVNELANAIRTIALNPAKLRDMQEACFEAANQFSSDMITRKYLEFYHEPFRS